MKAFVAGATGETGRRIVRLLVSRGISVKAFVRDVDVARAILPIEAELVRGDVLDRDTISLALADCTLLFCATGARPSFDPTGPYKVDYEGTKQLIDAAKEHGIEHFVMVSSLCVSRFFHPLNLFWLVLWWKQQAERHLLQSGLTYTIVRPGGLRNEEDDRSLVMAAADTLFEGSVPRQKVAETCVEAVFQPDARNRIVEIVAREDAPQQSYQELFASVKA
ncbi:putative NAD-dependent epimerase [Halomicronema hongdechloris C2206]|uniref:NAD-dependent epimerase n=1 Tax=Halomicronema hongdechloris C2206 TaxID=1641165 RepID=A0A1Z3HLX4_9CYAN|nr:NAD(P)H-binding protein [Halomicronema hongdechloris]ASC71276.1 putative NAD-dependent epimerase [Halomicronema hongdechloris C2206]